MGDNKSKVRFDGWGNFLSGFKNRRANKAEMTYDDQSAPLTASTLWSLWRSEGVAHRAISCVAEDMTRKGFDIIGDTYGIAYSELVRLRFSGVLYNALCMSQLFGGSLVYMSIDDGQSIDEPVSVNSIRGIRLLRYITPDCVAVPQGASFITDIDDPYMGMPEKLLVNMGDASVLIHISRFLIIPWLGEDSVLRKRAYAPLVGGVDSNLRFLGYSVIGRMQRQLSALGSYSDALVNLVQEAVVGKYKVAGLAAMLASRQESSIMRRMDIIQESKSVINSVLLDADANEDYQRDTLSFSGINGLSDTFMIMLSGVTGIPVTRLFGRSPSGLDASGESDINIYYDMVSSYQESMLTKNIQRLVFYVNQYKQSVFIEPSDAVLNVAQKGARPSGKGAGVEKVQPATEADVQIVWTPLYQMTEKERAELYFTNAQADMYYKNAGVLDAREIRRARFLNGYEQFITVDTEDPPVADLPETEIDMEEE